MTTDGAKGLEYRHIKCGENMVNAVLREHAMFRWELVATQTIVSKESHLETGGFLDAVLGNGDVIYSVWSEERFATIDLKRDKNIPNLEQIKKMENEYFQIVARLQEIGCSPMDNYATPYEKKANWPLLGCLFVLYVLPGILYQRHINKENEKIRAMHRELRPKLLEFLETNKHILNV
jgi:hypothetical protein